MNSILKNNLTIGELQIALVAAHQTIWELNSKLEYSIKEKSKLQTILSTTPSINTMEKMLANANQEIWELNSKLESCIRERDLLKYHYNRPLYKIIAERIRNKLREFRKIVGLYKE